jgi:hypothetical protein
MRALTSLLSISCCVRWVGGVLAGLPALLSAQTFNTTPNPLAFGSVISGANTTLEASVTNASSSTASITGIDLGGSTIFARVGGTCPTIFPTDLGGGANCSILITTQSAREGVYFAALNVRTLATVASTPISASITRALVPPRLSTESLEFGIAASGAGFSPRRVVIDNTYNEYTVNFSGLSGSPVEANNSATTPTRFLTTGSCFTSLNVSAPLIPSLNSGATCYVDILPILPNTAGNFDSTITIATSEGPLTVAVKASVGAAPDVLEVNPTTVSFGSVPSGATLSKYFTFTNSSTTETVVEELILPSNVTVVASTCAGSIGFVVPPKSSCAMILNIIMPDTLGSTLLEIDLVSAKGNLTIPVSATVVQATTPLTVMLSSLDFGVALPGDYPYTPEYALATRTVYPTYTTTFTNSSANSVSLVSLSGGTSATIGNNPLAVFPTSGSCYVSSDTNAALRPSLAPGESCNLNISARFGIPLPNVLFPAGQVNFGGLISLVTSAGTSSVSLRAVYDANYRAYPGPLQAKPISTTLLRSSVADASESKAVTFEGTIGSDTINFVYVPAPFVRSGGSCPTTFPAVASSGCTMIFSVPANAQPASTSTINATAVVGFSRANRAVDLVLVTGTPAAGGDEDGDGIPYAVEVAEIRDPFVKDNAIFAGSHPTNANRWFAMQQYRDFLSREADAAGLAGWTNRLSTSMSREAVIQGFFGSPEFQSGVPSVVRLYLGFFKRIPDSAGLKGWVTAVRAGAPLGSVASAFAQSAEFQQTYGALTNAQFVTLVYQNVLGRAPDIAGYNGWLELLQGGMSRGDMMVGFTESTEYQLNTSSNVFVIMMYEGMLRRAAEQAGYDYWVSYVNSGKDALDLTRGFLNSSEYRNRFLP